MCYSLINKSLNKPDNESCIPIRTFENQSSYLMIYQSTYYINMINQTFVTERGGGDHAVVFFDVFHVLQVKQVGS